MIIHTSEYVKTVGISHKKKNFMTHSKTQLDTGIKFFMKQKLIRRMKNMYTSFYLYFLHENNVSKFCQIS